MLNSNGLDIQRDVQLADLSTMGVKAISKYFATLDDINLLPEIINFVETTHSKFLILGGGSNVLFIGDFDGLIIKNELNGIQIVEETETQVLLKIGAGENWHALVEFCVGNRWFGIENLALIPGTVGAAPIQNIGAYGVELVDVFVELETFDIDNKTFNVFNKRDCKFGYRDSIFKNTLKNKFIITSVTIRLQKSGEVNFGYSALKSHFETLGISTPSIDEIFKAVVEVRQSKLPDPAFIGNNGSFFKNPVIPVFHYDELKQKYPDIPSYPVTEQLVKVPAGWLIDKAGWKGYRKGDAGIHAKQALVLVNYGYASGQDIYQLSEMVLNDVIQKFGIKLEREVNIFGGN
ncbi:MAG: UDP-N-acetylmuramate dehydrogenase [Balneolaceae bacterium]